MIYGDRGIGKSSLASQIGRIAQGDVELLAHFGEHDRALAEEQRYLVLQVTCTVTTRGITELLQLMVDAMRDLELLVEPDSSDGYGRLVDRTTKRKVTAKFVEVEWVKRYEAKKGVSERPDLTPMQRFSGLVDHLASESGQSLLFILDEFDKINDTTGIASFLKESSSEFVKFLVVGIAESHTELMSEHESIARHLRPVLLPIMTLEELDEIIERAEASLAARDVDLAFSARARRRLVGIAGGYPWFVHMIGKTALTTAYDNNQVIADSGDVVGAVRDLSTNQLAQPFNEAYTRAVKTSRQRELVLRVLAMWRERDIPTHRTYEACRQLGVRSPSNYRGQLAHAYYGPIIRIPNIPQQGPCQFIDPMFKVYVSMREPVTDINTDRIAEACAGF